MQTYIPDKQSEVNNPELGRSKSLWYTKMESLDLITQSRAWEPAEVAEYTALIDQIEWAYNAEFDYVLDRGVN